MQILSIGKQQFESSVEKTLEENQVYGVKQKKPFFAFARLVSGEELCFDYDIAVLPPNKYLLPPTITLLKYRFDPQPVIEDTIVAEPTIIIGIHSYDLHALKLLDAIFDRSLIDINYRARRNSTAIIGIDCLHPWQYSFAMSMGTAFPPRLFDLWLTDLGDELLIEVGSEGGEQLHRRYLNTVDASKAQIEHRERLRQQSLKRYQLSVDISPQEIPRMLDKGWNSIMWQELGQKCFSCGSCTMVCPTCVCFDVRDKVELDQQGGERYRRWDSCMFDAFAKVASGENFRPSGVDRLRHRLYRKGKYMLERWGELGCVGCGRCIHACLVDIASPVQVYNRLAREQSGE